MADPHLVAEVKIERLSTFDSQSQENLVALTLDYDIDVKYEKIEEQCLETVTGPLGVTSASSDTAAPLLPKPFSSCFLDEREPSQLTCSHCSVTYDNEQKLREHMAYIHIQDAPKHLCTLCGKSFDGAHADLYMEIHMLLKHEMKTYKCIICHFSSYETCEIIDHLSKNHSDTVVLNLFKLLSCIVRPLCKCYMRSICRYVNYRNPGSFSGNITKAFNNDGSLQSAADTAVPSVSSSQAEPICSSEILREIKEIFSKNDASPVTDVSCNKQVPPFTNSVTSQPAVFRPLIANSVIGEAAAKPQIVDSSISQAACARTRLVSTSFNLSHLPPDLTMQIGSITASPFQSLESVKPLFLVPKRSDGKQALLTGQSLQSNSLLQLNETNIDGTRPNSVSSVLGDAKSHNIAMRSPVASTLPMQSPVASTLPMQSPVVSTVTLLSPVVSTLSMQSPVVSTIPLQSPVASTIPWPSPVASSSQAFDSTCLSEPKISPNLQLYTSGAFNGTVQNITQHSETFTPSLREFMNAPSQSLSACNNETKTLPRKSSVPENAKIITVHENEIFKIECTMEDGNFECLPCEMIENSSIKSIYVGEVVYPMKTANSIPTSLPSYSVTSTSPSDGNHVHPAKNPSLSAVCDMTSGSPINQVNSLKRPRESSCQDDAKLYKLHRAEVRLQRIPDSILKSGRFDGDYNLPHDERSDEQCAARPQASSGLLISNNSKDENLVKVPLTFPKNHYSFKTCRPSSFKSKGKLSCIDKFNLPEKPVHFSIGLQCDPSKTQLSEGELLSGTAKIGDTDGVIEVPKLEYATILKEPITNISFDHSSDVAEQCQAQTLIPEADYIDSYDFQKTGQKTNDIGLSEQNEQTNNCFRVSQILMKEVAKHDGHPEQSISSLKTTCRRKSERPKRPCCFCKKMVSKLPRHLSLIHSNEKEVRELSTLPTKERLFALTRLRHEGIFQHNKASPNDILVNKRSKTSGKSVMCLRCKGMYSSKYFNSHRCGEGKSFGLRSSLISKMDDGQDFKVEVLNRFQDGDIGTVCRTNLVIMKLGHDQAPSTSMTASPTVYESSAVLPVVASSAFCATKDNEAQCSVSSGTGEVLPVTASSASCVSKYHATQCNVSSGTAIDEVNDALESKAMTFAEGSTRSRR